MRTTIKMLLGISTLLAGLMFWNSASAATYNAYFLKIKNETNRLIWVSVTGNGVGSGNVEYLYVQKGEVRDWKVPSSASTFGYDRKVQVTVEVLAGETQEVANTGTWIDMATQTSKKHKFLGANQPQYLMIKASMTGINQDYIMYRGDIQGEEYTLTVTEGRELTPVQQEEKKEAETQYAYGEDDESSTTSDDDIWNEDTSDSFDDDDGSWMW